jgi:hypothetical protein
MLILTFDNLHEILETLDVSPDTKSGYDSIPILRVRAGGLCSYSSGFNRRV